MCEQPQQKPVLYRLGPHPLPPGHRRLARSEDWALSCPPLPGRNQQLCDPLLPACWDSFEGGYRATGGVGTEASVPHDCVQVLGAHTIAPGEGEADGKAAVRSLWPAPTLTPVPEGTGQRQALICHRRDTPSLRGARPRRRDWREGGGVSLLSCLRAPKLRLPLRRNWSSSRGPLVTPHKVPKQPFSLWPLPPCD